MRPLEEEDIVRMLAARSRDAQGSPTIDREEAVAIIRWHLEIEEIEVNATDEEIWQMWQSTAAEASADDINGGVLERVLDRIKQET
jgi:hypothetical protein